MTMMAETHPDLAKELVDRSLGFILKAGSGKKVLWRCSLGHTWSISPNGRTSHGIQSGCPYCSGKYVMAGFNDISTTHPEIADELLDQSLRYSISAGRNAPVDWQCGLGHIWTVGPNSRRFSRSGCPVCSGSKVVAGFNDLATTNPDIAYQLVDKSIATSLTAGSNKRVEWQCDDGHRWVTSVCNRTGNGTNGTNCPICAYAPKPGKTLRETHPDIAKQLVDASLADTVSAGSTTKALWVCDVGHEWMARVYSRVEGHGCPLCCVTGYRDSEPDARLYLVLPPGKHPIGFGKVHSEKRYDIAMKDAYDGCLPIAYAVGNGASVSAAESSLKSIKGRPTGKIYRLQTESLSRSCDSIDLWARTAEQYGLIITWLVDLVSIDLITPEIPRVHAVRDFCSCSADGLNRHDSKSSCCMTARSAATDIIKHEHYLHAAPGGTIHYFTWRCEGEIKAIMTLGTGSSANGAKSLSTFSDVRALELTRLWAAPDLDITLSAFVSKCFASIDYPLFVYSYADSERGHLGGIYRACSFNYAGWSDMNRRSPLRRKPDNFTAFKDWPITSAKHRYWKLIGLSGRRRAEALDAAGWPSFDHRTLGFAPKDEHRRILSKDIPQYEIAAR